METVWTVVFTGCWTGFLPYLLQYLVPFIIVRTLDLQTIQSLVTMNSDIMIILLIIYDTVFGYCGELIFSSNLLEDFIQHTFSNKLTYAESY